MSEGATSADDVEGSRCDDEQIQSRYPAWILCVPIAVLNPPPAGSPEERHLHSCLRDLKRNLVGGAAIFCVAVIGLFLLEVLTGGSHSFA